MTLMKFQREAGTGRLQDKVALVTGGGGAIGRGVALRLAREGAKLVVLDNDHAAGQATVEAVAALAGQASFIAAEPAEKAQLQRAIEDAAATWGRIDILVNAAEAPLTPHVPLHEKTDAMFSQALGADLYGSLWAMQAVYPIMRDQGGGRIVNVGSGFGQSIHKLVGDYNAAKEAIHALTRTAACEWGPDNILVNSIVPLADTPAYQAYRQARPDEAAYRLTQNPMQRVGDPQRDIGGAVLFLVSPDTQFITGHVIFADGGGHLALPTVEPSLATA